MPELSRLPTRVTSTDNPTYQQSSEIGLSSAKAYYEQSYGPHNGPSKTVESIDCLREDH